MSSYKSNFESVRFLSDDPNYFEQGYELGKEFVVYGHNSPLLEQKEKNRNIPRKSVRQNNFSSGWDDEYRNRGFDERGYRNLTSERMQPYESKQWAVGGTGVLTACVRDMTRSEHILEREQQDLAFEGLQDLMEIKTGLDAQIITRISHVYTYKSTHHPKHESVKPLTQCRVCLDDFLDGEPLRLMGCTHSFHRYCIDKWLEEDQHCPVCKNDIIVMAQHMGVKVDREKYKKKYW